MRLLFTAGVFTAVVALGGWMIVTNHKIDSITRRVMVLEGNREAHVTAGTTGVR